MIKNKLYSRAIFTFASLMLFALVSHGAVKETALLSLQNGTKLSQEQIQKVLHHPVVLKSRSLFQGEEKKYLVKIKAQHLTKSWVLELKDESAFAELEKYIYRQAYPLNLEWNDLQTQTQQSLTTMDPFLNLQWGLKNDGRDQTIDLDPVKTYRIPGVAGEDIHWPSSATAAGSPLRDPVIVAVLDTGIDKTHPDLQKVLVRKESECKALEKFLQCVEDKDRKTCEKIWMNGQNSEVDQDHNGYPMDCEGWSLLGGTNEAQLMGRPDFGDDQGHGTHVAGIIGALSNNGVGGHGVSSRVKILPVQVIGIQPSEPIKPLSFDPLNPLEDNLRGRNRSLGDMVARGVIYALRSGARVINFSMGWPQARDSEFMRLVIAEAIKQGVVVVAAAGNDSTRALLRPCAYPGVICVGAHGPDGGLAHFSNYGSGVDIAAPGIQIFSTYPQELHPIRFRSTGGFEFLSGTSQASPFVAGVVGDLLAQGIPRDEVYPRLIASTRPLKKNLALIEGLPHMEGRSLPADQRAYEKYLLSGLMDVEKAVKISPEPVILPATKESIEIPWDRQSSKLKSKFTLKNFWKDVEFSAVKVTAAFLRPHPESPRPRVQSVRMISSGLGSVWKNQEVREFEVEMVIDDNSQAFLSRIPSELDLTVDIESQGRRRRVVLENEIVVSLTPNSQAADILRLPLKGLPRARFEFVPIDENWDLRESLRDYFVTVQDNSQWQVSLATQNGNENGAYETKGRVKIKVEGDDKKIRSQYMARLNLGGENNTQYVLGFIEDNSDDDERKPSPVQFFFFDSAMKLVHKFNYDSARAQMPYQIYWQQIGGTRRPAWVGNGKKPQPRTGLRERWENPQHEEASETRFYYLDANEKLQALETHEGFKIVDVIEPTKIQKSQGRIPILLAKNTGTEAQPSYVYQFAVAEVVEGKVENFREMDFFGTLQKYRNLLDTRVDRVSSLDPSKEEYRGSFWFSEEQSRRQRLSIFDQQNFEFLDQDLSALHRQYDSALWVRSTYYGRERKGAFVLTNSEIQYHDLKTRNVASRSFERYTFFPDSFMTNSFFPLTVKDSKSSTSHLPALFTTESSALSRGVKMVVPVFANDGNVIELVSPARLRFKSVEGCRPLDTPVFRGEKAYAFDYYCGENILRIPLSY